MLNRIIDLLLPPVLCLGCEEPRKIIMGAALCEKCVQELEDMILSENVCPNCLSPKGQSSPCDYCIEGGMLNLCTAYAPYHYHGIVQKLIVQLKFNSIEDAAKPLADAMYECIKGSNFDVIVPVPLHARRLQERGYNQAEVLAWLVSKKSNIPVVNALIRTKNTRRQSSMRIIEHRKENVENAFSINADVKGKKILLVDDVRTTGSTARACAKKLIENGASEVALLTGAVAPPRGDDKKWKLNFLDLLR
jgi:competence protein ComFC